MKLDQIQAKDVKLQDYDGISFYHDKAKYNCLLFHYDDQSEKYPGSSLGDMYQIMLYKETDGELYDIDFFEAILIDPMTYVMGLIKHDWCGIVGLKTEKSGAYFQEVIELLNNEDEE
jgi:hypothetical protein